MRLPRCGRDRVEVDDDLEDGVTGSGEVGEVEEVELGDGRGGCARVCVCTFVVYFIVYYEYEYHTEG